MAARLDRRVPRRPSMIRRSGIVRHYAPRTYAEWRICILATRPDPRPGGPLPTSPLAKTIKPRDPG